VAPTGVPYVSRPFAVESTETDVMRPLRLSAPPDLHFDGVVPPEDTDPSGFSRAALPLFLTPPGQRFSPTHLLEKCDHRLLTLGLRTTPWSTTPLSQAVPRTPHPPFLTTQHPEPCTVRRRVAEMPYSGSTRRATFFFSPA